MIFTLALTHDKVHLKQGLEHRYFACIHFVYSFVIEKEV